MNADLGLTMKLIKEADEVKELLVSFGDVFPNLKGRIRSYDEFSEKLASYANVYVCLKENSPCGLLVYYSNDTSSKTAYISLIGVLEEYRGISVGKFMLDWCMYNSSIVGMSTVKLEVELNNENAIRFYKRNGFFQCSVPVEGRVYMSRKI